MALTKHFLNIPAVYRLGTKGIGYIPTFLSYTISQGIADLSYIFYKPAVKNVKRNLALVFPGFSGKELASISKQLFRNYSKYLVDYGRFTNLNNRNILKKIVHFDGKENLDAALRMNKGIILLTAHLGNWELGGIFFGSYGVRINVITLPDQNPEIDDIRRCYREKHNVRTITIGNSPFSTIELVKALNNNEIIAMLIDRYTSGHESITIDFFNKPTLFPRGPFILSRITGAPIIVAFVVSENDGYRGIIKEPFIVANEKEEYESLKKVVRILEEFIEKYPDQWYNFRQI